MKRASGKVLGFRCIRCGRGHALKSTTYVCAGCGGNLDVVYDYRAIKKRISRRKLKRDPDTSIWRYSELLPVNRPDGLPFVHIGGTPLYHAQRLGRGLGLSKVYIKDDGRNPSASFKDRAGAVALAKALELKKKVITGASTGNAASSLSCLAAALGVKTIVFVPETAPPAKITQLLVFGATVIAVKGTYDEAFDLCLKASAEYGWYNRNTGYNPFTREGKKTCSFEIAEQLGWDPPDKVFVSVGDGNIISGLWKGFLDLYRVGLTKKLPKMIAVQAEGSNAVKKAFDSDGVLRPVGGKTVADSISVELPRDGEAAVEALRESKGFSVEVSDRDILEAITLTARSESVFGEPAGVASIAGLRKAALQGLVNKGERVVAVVTGNGLKDIASARKAVGKPHAIRPELSDLKKLVKNLKL